MNDKNMYQLHKLSELTSHIWTTEQNSNTVYVELDDASVVDTYTNGLGATVIVLSNGKSIVLY